MQPCYQVIACLAAVSPFTPCSHAAGMKSGVPEFDDLCLKPNRIDGGLCEFDFF